MTARPGDPIRYLTLDDVLVLHRSIMQRTGYPPQPLRDPGAIASALARPQMAAHYEDADLIRQAVLASVGIAEAQAFLDGNKRTAFAVLDVFLRLNGHVYDGDPIELAKKLEAIGSREADLGSAEDHFVAWLRERVTGM